MISQDSFIARLRRHRERNGISLAQIGAETRINPELLEALERNDLSAWPRGVYARAWMRAYASAIGLDPIDTVDEFCRLFPQGDRRAGATLHEIAAIVGQPPEYRDEFSHATDRRQYTPQINVLPSPPWHVALTRPARALWARFAAVRAQASLRRTPRTSS